MDEEDSIVGRGLSRFSKYTRKQRERVVRVTAAMTGEEYKARNKVKFGIRIITVRELTPEEVEAYRSATVEPVPAPFTVLDVYPMPKRVTSIVDRFYASRTRRENAYSAMCKRSRAGKEFMALRIARPENGTRDDVAVEIVAKK